MIIFQILKSNKNIKNKFKTRNIILNKRKNIKNYYQNILSNMMKN
jgi:hypothetical protein